jgi:hypothetical protein
MCRFGSSLRRSALALVLAVALLLGVIALPLRGSSGVLAVPAYPNCDVNLSGHVTIGDALLVAQHVVGLTTLTGLSLQEADCNGNGSVTISDGLLIAQQVVGLA